MQEEPKLEAPGAGLPFVESIVTWLYFRFRLWTGSSEKFVRSFNKQRAAIRAMVEGLDAESGGRRVLVEPMRALEDSSRYWSVWMTLEHLRIVNARIAKGILALHAGHVPPGSARTQDVKPAEATQAVVAEYEAACDAVLAAMQTAGDQRSAVTYHHAWFGALDTLGWQLLAAAHMNIHRGQIEKILAGLKSAGRGN